MEGSLALQNIWTLWNLRSARALEPGSNLEIEVCASNGSSAYQQLEYNAAKAPGDPFACPKSRFLITIGELSASFLADETSDREI